MSDRGVRALLATVAIAGLAISLYLTWSYTVGVAPVCVGASEGCATVQSSPYSRILGTPVPVLGLVGYVGLLLSAVLRGAAWSMLGLFVALLGTLFSGYLTWLELFVIEAICQWCMVSAALMVVALGLTALRLRYV